MYKNKSDLSQPGRFYLIWQCLERLAGVENITVSFTLIFCYSPLSVWDSFVFNHVRQDKRVPESWEPAWLLTCLFWSYSLERGPWSHLKPYRPHLIGQNMIHVISCCAVIGWLGHTSRIVINNYPHITTPYYWTTSPPTSQWCSAESILSSLSPGAAISF